MTKDESLSSEELIQKWSRFLASEKSFELYGLTASEKAALKLKFEKYYTIKVKEVLNRPEMKNGDIPISLRNWKKMVLPFPEEKLEILIENVKEKRT